MCQLIDPPEAIWHDSEDEMKISETDWSAWNSSYFRNFWSLIIYGDIAFNDRSDDEDDDLYDDYEDDEGDAHVLGDLEKMNEDLKNAFDDEDDDDEVADADRRHRDELRQQLLEKRRLERELHIERRRNKVNSSTITEVTENMHAYIYIYAYLLTCFLYTSMLT